MADPQRRHSSASNGGINSWNGSEVKYTTPPLSTSDSANSLTGLHGMHHDPLCSQMDGSGAVFFTVGATADKDEFDEDGSNAAAANINKKDLHTLNEQKRRDAIRQAYCQLEEIVPLCRQTSPGGVRLSRAAILQKGIEYIAYLNEQSAKQQEQLESLKKEVTALRIMKENYERITKVQSVHQTSTAQGSSSDLQVPEELKFRVFQGMMDALFQSYNANISLSNFESLSSCTINWLEQYCKPQVLKDLLTQQLHIAQLASHTQLMTSSHHMYTPTQSSLH